MRCEDSVGLTPYLVKACLPRHWQWFAHSGPITPLCVMMIRFGYSLRALNRQLLPRLGVARYIGALSVMTVISTLDTLGAFTRSVGLSRHSARGHLEVLSYHGH